MPRVLFCKSSTMFQSPEWTSRRVLSWDGGGRGRGGTGRGKWESACYCWLQELFETVRNVGRGDDAVCTQNSPRIAVDNIHAWRSPHPRPERVETPRRGSGEVPPKFPAVAKVSMAGREQSRRDGSSFLRKELRTKECCQRSWAARKPQRVI